MAKIRVKMLTLLAGPTGTIQPGKVVELDKAEALELIKARSAIECDAEGNPLNQEDRRERATAKPAPETRRSQGGKPETTSADKGEKSDESKKPE